MMNQMILALALFVIMYVLLLVFSEKRWIIALSAAALFLVLGIVPLGAAPQAVNWNVLMMLTGTMAIVELFIESGRWPRLVMSRGCPPTPLVRTDRVHGGSVF